MKISFIQRLSHFAEVRPSPLHGLGLFAKRDIPENTVWWKARRSQVMLLNRPQFHTLMASRINPVMENMLSIASIYGYYAARLDSIVICLDDARYVNHSEEPNSGAPLNGDPLSSRTLRLIREGEEITEDYGAYDHCAWSSITCTESFLQPNLSQSMEA